MKNIYTKIFTNQEIINCILKSYKLDKRKFIDSEIGFDENKKFEIKLNFKT